MKERRIYLDNFWSLYFDFIEAFSKLCYLNIPLPILVNFRHYLDENIKQDMTNQDFKKILKSSIRKCEIQTKFQKWLNPLRQLHNHNNTLDGKVLLNYMHLRFSRNNFVNYFNPKEAVILSQRGKNNLQGLPMHDINDYQVDVSKISNKIIEEAKIIFSTLSEHPVFNDIFFYNSFIRNIPNIINTIASVDKYLEKNEISCIIVGTTEDLMSRILTLVGATKGIPSICMQHGLLCGEEAYMPIFSSKVGVYGFYEKEWYQERGVTSNRIEITGHPRFDDIFTQKYINKAEFQKIYQLNPLKKTILFATQPNNTSLWNETIERLANLPQFEILIKPHPVEMSKRDSNGKKLVENYITLQNKYKTVKVISDRKVNLYDILSNIDAVIIINSTVGLETILFNKPLFILDDKSSDYYDRMQEFIFSEPSELVGFITNYFEDEKLCHHSKVKNEEFLGYAYPQKLSGPLLKEEIKKLIQELKFK